jgi:hypothetical protein
MKKGIGKGKKANGASIFIDPVFDAEITAQKMDTIIEFLPIFEKDGFAFWHGKDMPGATPNFFFSKETRFFIPRLYQDGWLINFDWGKWQRQAEKYALDPDKVARAGLMTLRQLLTVHVRKDRFCEGHLDHMFRSGHILAILKRIKQIREGNKS